MGIRPSVKDKDCNVTIHLGSEYDTVKFVADNMDFLKSIEASAKIFMMYLGEHATPPTTRLDGSPIQSGDYYLDSTHNLLAYADVDALGVITWVSIDINLIKSYADAAEHSKQDAVNAASDAHASKVASAASAQLAENNANIASTASQEAKDAATETKGYRDTTSNLHDDTVQLKADVTALKSDVVNLKSDVLTSATQVQANKDATDTNVTTTTTARDEAVQSKQAAKASELKAEEWAVSPSTNNSSKFWAEEARKAATSSVISGGPFTPTSAMEYPALPTSYRVRPGGVGVLSTVLPDIYYIVQFNDPAGKYRFTAGQLAGKEAFNQYQMYYDRQNVKWTLIPAPTVTLDLLGGVAKTGDTMTGDLIIENATPSLRIKKGSKYWGFESDGSTASITESGVGPVIEMTAGAETVIRKPRASDVQENNPAALTRKDYTDTKVAKVGDTMTGSLTIADTGDNTLPAADSAKFDGLGVIGNRGTMYVTNGSSADVASIMLGIGGVHNDNNKFSIEKTKATSLVPLYENSGRVYSPANKPSPSDVVGALSIDFGRID